MSTPDPIHYWGISGRPSLPVPPPGAPPPIHTPYGKEYGQEGGEVVEREEIGAWRCWRLEQSYREVLWSCHWAVPWEGPSLRAHECPTLDNVSGVYAFRPKGKMHPTHAFYPMEFPVIGLVALSGTVVVGTAGYRAEVCTVRRLWVRAFIPGSMGPHRPRDLEELYQCEVEVVDRDKGRNKYEALLDDLREGVYHP